MINKREFIFGIGAGIVVASFIVFIAYTFDYKEGAINYEVAQMTEDELINKARKLGMVFITESDIQPISSSKEEPIKELDKNQGIVKSDVVEEDQTIIIDFPSGSSSGAISKMLYDNGVIHSTEDFNNFLKTKKVTKRLRQGAIQFEKDMEFDEILKKISQ